MPVAVTAEEKIVQDVVQTLKTRSDLASVYLFGSCPLRHHVFRDGRTLFLGNRDCDVSWRYTTFREYQDYLDFTGWRDVN